MDSKKAVETNKKRIEEISDELRAISSSLELEVEQELAPIKAQALAKGAEQSKEIKKLETEVALLKVDAESQKKLEEKRRELEALRFELMSEEEKHAAYQEMKSQCDAYIAELRQHYGLE